MGIFVHSRQARYEDGMLVKPGDVIQTAWGESEVDYTVQEAIYYTVDDVCHVQNVQKVSFIRRGEEV